MRLFQKKCDCNDCHIRQYGRLFTKSSCARAISSSYLPNNLAEAMNDTLVVVCAIMGQGETRYMYDALRFVQLVVAKGVAPENTHLFVEVDHN